MTTHDAAMVPRPAQVHPRATPAFVLGLLGLVGFFAVVPLVMSPLAWYLGAVAQRESEREPTRWRRGEARAATIMGIIGTALLGLFVVLAAGAATLSLIVLHHDSGYGG